MKIPAGENVLHLVDQVGTRAGIITEVGEINRVVRGAAAHGAVGTAQDGMGGVTSEENGHQMRAIPHILRLHLFRTY